MTVEVIPLTNHILIVHVDEGYVIHPARGKKRSDAEVVIEPLDTGRAQKASAYRITSANDPAYTTGRSPVDVGRKTKGTDFAWFSDRWVDGRAVNDRADHTKEHWLYLRLPSPMVNGKTYTVTADGLKSPLTLAFSERKTRSEAVRVNNLGYATWAPAKYGYVFHWMGDQGGLNLADILGKRFWLLDTKTGQSMFEGRVAPRGNKIDPETFHLSDAPPSGNFNNADVAECDFSGFSRPGEYRLAVESVGTSFPFRIAPDAYAPAFTAVVRGLYHNRSGIELRRPYTEFVRPAPHNPKLTPGFAGKLLYTTVRFQEWGSEGGNKEALLAGSKGPLDAWGWYQDAGDWDGYTSHYRVPTELLMGYLMAPKLFRDGELNLPESGNGIPDLVDEAAWLPRYGHRLRQELLRKQWGTGGVSGRVAGDAFGSDNGPQDVGRGSWEDVDRIWMVAGEDPVSTYRYAGSTALLALALRQVGKPDPERVDWVREAREAAAWAKANTRTGDEADQGLRDHRAFANAALFALTGEAPYEQALADDLANVKADTLLWGNALYGPAVYALFSKGGDPALRERLRAAGLATAADSLATVRRRALRWGGNFSFPMLIGQQTTPQGLELAVGYALSRDRAYLGALATTADHNLGINNLGITWITGVGPRHPNHVFHMDAWYNQRGGEYQPGLIPYGPWRKEADVPTGPWHVGWPHQTVYPPIDQWPGSERWFDNRNSPMNSEFTVHQNNAPASVVYGLLKGDW